MKLCCFNLNMKSLSRWSWADDINWHWSQNLHKHKYLAAKATARVQYERINKTCNRKKLCALEVELEWTGVYAITFEKNTYGTEVISMVLKLSSKLTWTYLGILCFSIHDLWSSFNRYLIQLKTFCYYYCFYLY